MRSIVTMAFVVLLGSAVAVPAQDEAGEPASEQTGQAEQADEAGQGEPAEQPGQSGQAGQTGQREQTARPAAADAERFTPSEEVAADTAVAFPVDI